MVYPVAVEQTDNYLTIYLSSGIDAITTLSMDGVSLGNGYQVRMRLANENWADQYMQKFRDLVSDQQLSNATSSLTRVQLSSARLFDDWEEVNEPPLRPPAPVRI